MSGKYEELKPGKAKPESLPEASGDPKLKPKSGRTSTEPDAVIRRPLKKEGTILPGQVFPWKDYEEQGPAKPKGDEVVPPREPQATTPEDYHTLEYNYGKKLPKNRGIPIPMSPDESAGKPKTASAKSKQSKHAYKVNWT